MTIVLERRRSELIAMREEIASAMVHLHDADEGSIRLDRTAGHQHPADHATALVDKEMGESLEGSSGHIMREIDEALARIEAGTYGLCAMCGRPIPEERLDAVPYATLCLDDKRAEEHG
jgi:DnaK suppressor protein